MSIRFCVLFPKAVFSSPSSSGRFTRTAARLRRTVRSCTLQFSSHAQLAPLRAHFARADISTLFPAYGLCGKCWDLTGSRACGFSSSHHDESLAAHLAFKILGSSPSLASSNASSVASGFRLPADAQGAAAKTTPQGSGCRNNAPASRRHSRKRLLRQQRRRGVTASGPAALVPRTALILLSSSMLSRWKPSRIFSEASGAQSRHNVAHRHQTHVSDERRFIGILLLFSEFEILRSPLEGANVDD